MGLGIEHPRARVVLGPEPQLTYDFSLLAPRLFLDFAFAKTDQFTGQIYLGHILEGCSQNFGLRKFAILLCVKSHRCSIAFSVVGTVLDDGYLIVLIQHF